MEDRHIAIAEGDVANLDRGRRILQPDGPSPVVLLGCRAHDLLDPIEVGQDAAKRPVALKDVDDRLIQRDHRDEQAHERRPLHAAGGDLPAAQRDDQHESESRDRLQQQAGEPALFDLLERVGAELAGHLMGALEQSVLQSVHADGADA